MGQSDESKQQRGQKKDLAPRKVCAEKLKKEWRGIMITTQEERQRGSVIKKKGRKDVLRHSKKKGGSRRAGVNVLGWEAKKPVVDHTKICVERKEKEDRLRQTDRRQELRWRRMRE